MARVQANDYNHFVTKRRDLPNDKFINEQNENNKPRASTKDLDGCAAMTRQ